MACACAPALVTLRDEVNFFWPARDKASDGCCGDSAHATRKSDHNPTDGWAHALDIDEDLAPGLDLAWLWDAWLALPDPRIKYLIYERRIAWPNQGRVQAYTGPNAHSIHMHVSLQSWATHDTSPWLPRLFPPAPPEVPVRVQYITGDQPPTLVEAPDGDVWVIDHRDSGAVWIVLPDGAVLACGRAEFSAVVDAAGTGGLVPHLVGRTITGARAHGADGFHLDANGSYDVPFAVPADPETIALRRERDRLVDKIVRAREALA